MAVILSELARNTSVNAVSALLDGGTVEFQDEAGTEVATVTFDNPAFPAASGGEAQARAKASITRAIDRHVDAQAVAMQYNSAAHLASYVASSVPEWQAEAQAFVAWRDQVWTTALDLLADAEASGEAPSVEDVTAALPKWSDA